MKKDDIRAAWEKFSKGNGSFQLNPDKEHVDFVIDGVLSNEKQFGLKLCPCRLRDGTRQRDLEILCPCNFFSQETWKKEGRCWCGLFVKR